MSGGFTGGVSGFLWRMAGALVAGVIGLCMLLWALELTSLASFAAAETGGDSSPTTGTYLLMFAGLVLVNLATFYALTQWSRYLREHPNTKQFPVIVMVGVLILAGAAMVYGVATHSDWIRAQDTVPTTVRQGFIAYQVVFSTIIIATLVLLAVRWSPGFRRRPIED
ncbi:hypothetical protein [Demequina sp.]|uniref:hypothetical protein n=1 Tax=Demequina sp. TaxID=2050685 RepID=UPI003D13E10D